MLILPTLFFASPAPTLTLLSAQTLAATEDPSFTVNFGTANAGDKIVVMICEGAKGADATTVKINTTNSCTKDVTVNNGASKESVQFWYFDDAGGIIGGSLALDVNFSVGGYDTGVCVYRLTDVATGAAAASSTDTTGNPNSLSLNVAANGICIAGSATRTNGTPTYAWTGVTTEDLDAKTTYQQHSGAQDVFATAQTPLTVTATLSVAGVRDPVSAAVAYNPA